MLRGVDTERSECAQHDRGALSMTRLDHQATCHPERSEGSHSMGAEMLRSAQHDRGVLSMTLLDY